VEPLSPELVLVDPDLAEHARARLEDPAEKARQLVGARAVPAPVGARIEEPVEPPLPVGLAPRRRRYRGALMLAAAVVAVVLGLDLRGQDDTGSRASTPGAEASHPQPPAPAESPKTDVERSHKPAAVRAAKREPARSRPAKSVAASAHHRALPVPVKAPVLSWPRVKHARFYWVQLYRLHLPAAAKILDAWPHHPRLALPSSWVNAGRRYRLVPGRYRWEVRPQFGTRAHAGYTRLLASGTFVVPPR
jgi:hypothetical protein